MGHNKHDLLLLITAGGARPKQNFEYHLKLILEEQSCNNNNIYSRRNIANSYSIYSFQ